MAAKAQESCNIILQNLRSSNLNFSAQETPFSIFVTIRKSFTKNGSVGLNCFQSPVDQLTSNLDTSHAKALKSENQSLKVKINEINQACATLADDLEEEVLVETSLRLKNLQHSYSKLESSLNL